MKKLFAVIKWLFTRKQHTEIKDVCGIVMVADNLGIKYHKRGANLVVDECPYCGSKSTMYISPSKGIYKCFRCGENGTGVRLVMKNKHISYRDADELVREWTIKDLED